LSEQFGQEIGNVTLAAGVTESWRRTHEDASEAIGLDAIRELGEVRISKNFLPACEVEARLGFEIWELNRNRHAGKIRQKWKNA